MNATQKLIALHAKLRATLDTVTPGDGVLIEWLALYHKQAQDIAHPRTDAIPAEAAQRDILKELSRFTSDQKVVDWAHAQRITLPRGQFWWWLNPDNRTAFIKGVPNSNGIPRITNGIDVYIERADGTLMLGHHDWLKYNRKPRTDNSTGKPTQTHISTRDTDLARKIVTTKAYDLFNTKYAACVGKPCTFKPNGNADKDVERLAPFVAEYFQAFIQKATSSI